jgi:hypothetical protein
MVVFAALTLSAEQFFAPAVGNFAAWLRLSDDVAGATLLAFGNGAPDFFTQVAAITHGKSVDLPLALGEGVGAGMYVSCFCLGVAILVSPGGGGVAVPTGPFVRDVIGYLGGFVIFFIAAMDRSIDTMVRFLSISPEHPALCLRALALAGESVVHPVVHAVCGGGAAGRALRASAGHALRGPHARGGGGGRRRGGGEREQRRRV